MDRGSPKSNLLAFKITLSRGQRWCVCVCVCGVKVCVCVWSGRGKDVCVWSGWGKGVCGVGGGKGVCGVEGVKVCVEWRE